MIDEHTLAPNDWLRVVEDDYLETFLLDGGATVKVVVADEADRALVRERLAVSAASRGYLFAEVDAGKRKIHLLNGLFNEIALQIPWIEVAKKFMSRRLAEDSRKIPADGDVSIEALAEANDEAKDLIVRGVRAVISEKVYRDYDLSREFRTAATALCEAICIRTDDKRQRAADVRDWLGGTLVRLAPLRSLGIYRKISRNNARQLLFSTTAWLRKASYSGAGRHRRFYALRSREERGTERVHLYEGGRAGYARSAPPIRRFER